MDDETASIWKHFYSVSYPVVGSSIAQKESGHGLDEMNGLFSFAHCVLVDS